MNLNIVLLTLGMVIAHHTFEAIFPIIVDCCTEVAHHVPEKWLRRHVLRFDVQKGDLCKIPAVILYTKRKKLCASPHNKNVKRWVRRMSKNHQKAVNHGRKRRKTKRRRKTTRKL
uniref:Chemokine interleukin-8-like domain-containing protein n=1 Tax=Anolis carolinensis TaxID=28377 RepID=A0A803TY50_ANOCA